MDLLLLHLKKAVLYEDLDLGLKVFEVGVEHCSREKEGLKKMFHFPESVAKQTYFVNRGGFCRISAKNFCIRGSASTV